MTKLLAIGEVARVADMTPSTLRYYDEIGLVQPTSRVSGQRRYHPDVLRRLHIIAVCQRAGFSLEEIARLLGDGTTPTRRSVATTSDPNITCDNPAVAYQNPALRRSFVASSASIEPSTPASMTLRHASGYSSGVNNVWMTPMTMSEVPTHARLVGGVRTRR